MGNFWKRLSEKFRTTFGDFENMTCGGEVQRATTQEISPNLEVSTLIRKSLNLTELNTVSPVLEFSVYHSNRSQAGFSTRIPNPYHTVLACDRVVAS